LPDFIPSGSGGKGGRAEKVVLLDGFADRAERGRASGGADISHGRQVEREGLRQQMLSLEADEEAALASLKGSLGITGAQALNLSGSMAEILSRLKSTAGGKKLYRPDLVRAALEADAAAAEIALARSEVWEDITVGGEYEFMRTLDGSDLMNENFLGARVILPLPGRNRHRSRTVRHDRDHDHAQGRKGLARGGYQGLRRNRPRPPPPHGRRAGGCAQRLDPDPGADDLRDAIYHGAVKRVRPKAMTACVIIAGLMPILWSHGAGADVMKRIATPMVGGVITSTLMELLVYPAIFFIWRSRAMRKPDMG
jgi:hypothetical protein